MHNAEKVRTILVQVFRPGRNTARKPSKAMLSRAADSFQTHNHPAEIAVRKSRSKKWPLVACQKSLTNRPKMSILNGQASGGRFRACFQ